MFEPNFRIHWKTKAHLCVQRQTSVSSASYLPPLASCCCFVFASLCTSTQKTNSFVCEGKKKIKKGCVCTITSSFSMLPGPLISVCKLNMTFFSLFFPDSRLGTTHRVTPQLCLSPFADPLGSVHVETTCFIVNNNSGVKRLSSPRSN